MEKDNIKKIIAELIDKGESLGNILKILDSEYDVKMTFMELRILASEIEDIDWGKNDPPEDDEKNKDEVEEDTSGKTIVEINRFARPGIAMHGSVKFASGASANWIIDQTGRIGFEKSDGNPTPQDIEEFQQELQKALGA